MCDLLGVPDIDCVMTASERARFESLFLAHCPEVRSYARRRVGPDVADDVVADVFVVVWRRLEEVPKDALPWLLGCARRVIANQRRSTRRRDALVERLRTVGVSDDEQPIGGSGELRRALATLSESDREVLMLIAWEGLRPAQAAMVVGCSERAFAMRLHRARRRLAAELHGTVIDRPQTEVM